MPSVAPLQGRFDGGEVSPLLYGRVDSDRYKGSLALCKNWIATLQGGLKRRPGTEYIATAKDGANKVRLIPFEFSTTQAYMIEFGYALSGNGYIRFYANYGVVLSGGTPYEVSHPYSAQEIPQIKYVQSADVLYLVHPNHPPMKLERFAAASWQLVKAVFHDGPYLPINDIAPSLYAPTGTASGTSGSVTFGLTAAIGVTGAADNGSGVIRLTLDASHGGTLGFETGKSYVVAAVAGTTEANGTWVVTVIDATRVDLNGSVFVHTYSGPSGLLTQPVFASTDVGRHLRLQSGGKWAWGVITAYGSPISVTLSLQTPLTNTTVNAFALGVWSTTTGYPGAVGFHSDRLCFAGTTSYPQRIDASISSNYENFAPTQADGTVTDSNALSFSFNANDVNLIEWLSSEEKGLLSGSVSSEWVVRPSLSSGALTPTNINAARSTKWGSTAVSPVQVSKATLFIQRGGRKLREMMFYFDIDGFRATDLTELAEHITGTGVIDMAYQSLPISVVWLVRNDGALLGLTYERDMGQLRAGWHWHVLGGQSDAGGTPPVIESIAAIPDPTGVKDDVWMVVRRYVNGQAVRYIEYLTKIFEGIDLQQDAFFVDCGNTYDNPKAITGVQNAASPVVTAPGHGLTTGDKARFDGLSGCASLNGLVVSVTVINSNQFTATGADTTNDPEFVTGMGQVRKLVTTISGLTYLEGETVSILADGAVQPPRVVSNSGQITLDIPAAVVTIGYDYNSDGEMLRLEAGSRNGTALGKTRRIHRAGIMLHQSQGFQMGKSFSALDPVQFRTQGADGSGRAAPLFSGITTHEMEFDYDFDNQICFRVSGPVPCTLLAIMPMLETQDRA